MQVGLLYSRIRADEKLLLAELRDRGHDVVKVDVRTQQFGLEEPPAPLTDCDVVLDRCLATSRSVYATKFLDGADTPVVNSADTAAICADKVDTSLALSAAGVPTPKTTVAFTEESAMEAIESFGYPCVLKPVVGSWGRLLAKIDSRSAAEAVLEHKATLGHYEHSVFYVQEFVDKPGRDVRVVAVDGEPIAAMVRSSDHWLTNAAAGAETEPFELDAEVEALVQQASDAVGGGLLGIDLMETGVTDADGNEDDGDDADGNEDDGDDADGYTVHEVNHTVEFKALNGTVETDVPAAVVDWLESVVEDDDTVQQAEVVA